MLGPIALARLFNWILDSLALLLDHQRTALAGLFNPACLDLSSTNRPALAWLFNPAWPWVRSTTSQPSRDKHAFPRRAGLPSISRSFHSWPALAWLFNPACPCLRPSTSRSPHHEQVSQEEQVSHDKQVSPRPASTCLAVQPGLRLSAVGIGRTTVATTQHQDRSRMLVGVYSAPATSTTATQNP